MRVQRQGDVVVVAFAIEAEIAGIEHKIGLRPAATSSNIRSRLALKNGFSGETCKSDIWAMRTVITVPAR